MNEIFQLNIKVIFHFFQIIKLYIIHFSYFHIIKSDYNFEKQKLNHIIKVGEENFRIFSFANYSNGDMILSIIAYDPKEERNFYGIKNNGRPFFQK